jgi:hypothetical protein
VPAWNDSILHRYVFTLYALMSTACRSKENQRSRRAEGNRRSRAGTGADFRNLHAEPAARVNPTTLLLIDTAKPRGTPSTASGAISTSSVAGRQRRTGWRSDWPAMRRRGLFGG